MSAKMKSFKIFLRDKNFENIEFNKEKLILLWECCQIPDFVKKLMEITTR